MLRSLPSILVWLWLGTACTASLSTPPRLDSRQSDTPTLRADASAIAYVIQAERYVVQEHYQDAVDQYRLALVHDPYSAELHLRLARALGHLNQWFAAVELLEKGLRARPEHVELRLALGRLYLEIDDFAMVENTLRAIEPEQPGFKSAWLLRFESALWLGRMDWIEKLRTKVMHEMPESVCMMARLFEDHGREELARREYSQCRESSELDLLRLDFRESGGELSEKFKTFVTPQTLNHPLVQPVLDSSGLQRRGVELRRAHRQQPGDCHVLANLGHWYGQNQDQVRSLRYLKEAYRRCPKNPAIVLRLAWAYLSHGQREKAVELCQWILKQSFDLEYENEARKVIEQSNGSQIKEQ